MRTRSQKEKGNKEKKKTTVTAEEKKTKKGGGLLAVQMLTKIHEKKKNKMYGAPELIEPSSCLFRYLYPLYSLRESGKCINSTQLSSSRKQLR